MSQFPRHSLLVGIVITAASCGPNATKSGGAKLQAVLDNVASCFHVAVGLLQREPDELPLATFLAEAKEKYEEPPAGSRTNRADFSALRFDESRKKLLSAGREIHHQRGDVEWAHCSGGGAEARVIYRFICDGFAEQSQTTIVHAMGGGLRRESD